jgi:putative endonuclease
MLTSLFKLADFARHHGRQHSWAPDQVTGRRGEDIAHRFLQRAGMTVVARNHRTSGGSGEVDLVAWDGDTLVFVEVKTRSTAEYGPPERAIGEAKAQKLILAARDYARSANVPWSSARFDIVTVVLDTPPTVTLMRDAFTVRSPQFV